AEGKPLPEKYSDHALTGNWIGHRDCHIQNDWLLIYRIEEDSLVLVLSRTGTHSDIF
ncbi:MAG: type II toxin-antitoxin system YafQ family toxin, partial [Christensenellaceae bacterium]|nr:type II toxin-antitoxin system YafQ family toxin [Christensenellaceae bacterium]